MCAQRNNWHLHLILNVNIMYISIVCCLSHSLNCTRVFPCANACMSVCLYASVRHPYVFICSHKFLVLIECHVSEEYNSDNMFQLAETQFNLGFFGIWGQYQQELRGLNWPIKVIRQGQRLLNDAEPGPCLRVLVFYAIFYVIYILAFWFVENVCKKMLYICIASQQSCIISHPGWVRQSPEAPEPPLNAYQ